MKRAGIWVVSVPVRELASALSELRRAASTGVDETHHAHIGSEARERFGHVVP